MGKVSSLALRIKAREGAMGKGGEVGEGEGRRGALREREQLKDFEKDQCEVCNPALTLTRTQHFTVAKMETSQEGLQLRKPRLRNSTASPASHLHEDGLLFFADTEQLRHYGRTTPRYRAQV